ncbi:Alpha/Beta hydrolase protein [Penicillium hordei]|uniref:Alpha/Beta hydrolase protein n=1 Tax=Penicillium hordei TaxID=40994 RepID=A0AAD6DPY2_9EURO|nr:Alpha/Beta hydrolase protein [Penicillium hordei]KAJ5589629.1 Alpha/Beta hydrolase protein [Penicillium hordei]
MFQMQLLDSGFPVRIPTSHAAVQRGPNTVFDLETVISNLQYARLGVSESRTDVGAVLYFPAYHSFDGILDRGSSGELGDRANTITLLESEPQLVIHRISTSLLMVNPGNDSTVLTSPHTEKHEIPNSSFCRRNIAAQIEFMKAQLY